MLSFLVFCEMFLIDLCLLIIGKMQVGSSSVTRPLLDLFLWRLFRSIRLTLFFFLLPSGMLIASVKICHSLCNAMKAHDLIPRAYIVVT